MVNTKQNPIVNTQKTKRKKYKHITKVIKSQKKRARERKKRNRMELQKQPENN